MVAWRALILWPFLVSPAFSKPTEFQFHMREGNKYFKAFQNDLALQHFKIAVEIDPTNFDARLKYLRTNNAIGQNLRDQKGDRKIIEYYFRKNVEIAESLAKDFPNRAESFFSLAIAYGNLA